MLGTILEYLRYDVCRWNGQKVCNSWSRDKERVLGKTLGQREHGLIGKNEQPALLNEVIILWLSFEVYRVKLWKYIQNAPEHYMAKRNQVLDPLLTSKDAPEQVKVPVQLLLIFAKLFSSSKKTKPKNVSLDQLIGMDTAISQMRKLIRFS
ncbi:hypothetical protein Tco_1022450 [Tanacetum coccineum]